MHDNALAKRFTPASLLRFAAPNIGMMIFLSLYTIVDGIFISRLVGTLALSAVNMSYPVTSVQLAVGIMMGTGGSAIIARKLGEGRPVEARSDFTLLSLLSALIGLLFPLFGLPFLRPIMHLLGTSVAQMDDCMIYTRILLLFAPMLFLQTVFQSYFITAGKPMLGLVVTVLGGVANMVLDYVFMGPLQMGVAGAAIATGIGYTIPAVVGLVYFTFARKGSLYWTRFHFSLHTVLHTMGNGSSEMVTNIAVAVTTYLFNLIFLYYWAEDGVAAITIIQYYQFVFSAAFLGFSMGVAPVISFKYGANDREQLQKIIRYSLIFVLVCSAGMFALSKLSIAATLTIFVTADSPVFDIALDGFQLYAPAFLLMGISIFASAMFSAFSNGMVSAIISFSRTFLFLVGLMLFLPAAMGKLGIWLAVPAAELLGVLVSAGFLVWGGSIYGYAPRKHKG